MGALSHDLRVLPDRETLAEAVADEVTRIARESIDERGQFSVALAGGRTPEASYGRLGALGEPTEMAARRWRVFFGDERLVPPDSLDSNYGMARRSWLDASGIPASNVHPVPTELGDAAFAARSYEDELRRVFQLEGEERPVFDLVLLGLAADGHTASLFPGSPALDEAVELCVAARAPTSPHDRVTITLPVINAARNVVFVVAGEDKARVLERLLRDPRAGDEMPAARVHPELGALEFLVDRDAASRLEGDAS